MNKFILWLAIYLSGLTVAGAVKGAQTTVEEALQKNQQVLEQMSADYEGPMKFFMGHSGGNCNECVWIVAEGTITEETPKEFQRLFAGGSGGITVYLHSKGGDLGAGIKLGELFRSSGLDTAIGRTRGGKEPTLGITIHSLDPGVCYSACAYAFLGGVRRYGVETWDGEPVGEFGVHQFYTAEMLGPQFEKRFTASDLSVQQFITGILIDYVKRMGADPGIVSVVTKATPESIRVLSAQERIALGVDNMQPWSSGWRTVPYKNGAVATISVRTGPEKPLNVTIFCLAAAQGRYYILLSKAIPWWAENAVNKDAVFGVLISFDNDDLWFLGEKLPVERFHMIGTMAYVTVALPGRYFERLATSRKLQISVSVPRYLGELPMYGEISLEGAQPHLSLASRACY